MAEGTNFFSGLDGDLPNGATERVRILDNYQRETKQTLLNAFGQSSAYPMATVLPETGGANTLVLTANVYTALTAYIDNQWCLFVANATNTGAVTADLNGLGARPVRKTTQNGFGELDAGDIYAGGLYIIVNNEATSSWLIAAAFDTPRIQEMIDTVAFETALPDVNPGTDGALITNDGLASFWSYALTGDYTFSGTLTIQSMIASGHRESRLDMNIVDIADPDAICTAQAPAGAGSLVIDGVKASGGTATLNQGRIVTCTVTADETGKTLTITGINSDTGLSDTDIITLGTAGTYSTTKYFLTVTDATISAAASSLTVGQSDAVVEIDFRYGFATIEFETGAVIGKYTAKNAASTDRYTQILRSTNGGGAIQPASATNVKTADDELLTEIFVTSAGDDEIGVTTDDAGVFITISLGRTNVKALP